MGPAGAGTSWQRSIVALSGVVVFIIVIAALYWAQAVIIPVAAAVFLTFLLSPPVTFLQRRGLGRIPAVIVVVTLAGLLLAGLGWLVSSQVTALVHSLPQYRDNIRDKVVQLHALTSGGVVEEVKDLTSAIAKDIEKLSKNGTGKAKAGIGNQPDAGGQPAGVPPEPAPPVVGQPAGVPPEQSRQVVVQPAGAAGITTWPAALSPVLEGLGGAALASVLVVFMLLKREDLRNRLIRLIGHGRITTTTKAVDDAAQRVSRFLLMQVIVNGTYGLALGLGLYVFRWFGMDIPYAALWGFLAAVLRYIPYVGAWVAAALPITLSFAVNPGWGAPLAVLGLVLVLELVSNNFMEPWLYGQSIGVSEVALLVAAAFWTWLWGPIGLVLSAPLTVCLVVLGKYVPQLEFLDVLLGDAPALEPRLAFYQRLLARDQDEAADVVDEYAREHTPDQVYDELLVNALNFVKRDRGHGDLTDEDEAFILNAVLEIAEEVAVNDGVAAAPGPDQRAKLLAYPARDEVDEAALRLLAGALNSEHWEVEVAPTSLLISELTERIAKAQPDVVCIAALPPGGLAHARYLCKRLRQRFPDLKVLVGRWGLAGDHVTVNQSALTAAGADQVTASLREARTWLLEWRPVFEADAAPAKGDEPRERVKAAAGT
jgi:predicted PurR-regulated permease PerM